jgi:hypothetical protein
LASWTASTGVTTLGSFSTTATANGGSISGSTLTLSAADGTNPGLVSTAAQTFAGAKTFSAPIVGSVTGTAANVTGTVAIANGGTGATTKAAAFDALSPMTTAGDILYGGASGTATRLAKGTDGQVLTLASGVPTWANSCANLNTEEFTDFTISATVFTLTYVPKNVKAVYMFINGIRISNLAYSIDGTDNHKIIYDPTSRHAIVAGDRVQFDYQYCQ